MDETNAIVPHVETPKEIVSRQHEIIEAVRDVVKAHHVCKISNRDYVDVAGLTMLATASGCSVITGEPIRVDIDGIGAWKAAAKVVDRTGRQIGGGWGMVGDDESTWRNRPHFARASMAATRAAGKALRALFSPMVTAMGYEATPAEEMPSDDAHDDSPQRAPAKRVASTSKPTAPAKPKSDHWQPYSDGRDHSADDVLFVAGQVEQVTAKQTAKGNNRYGFRIGQEWFNSFSDTAKECVVSAGKGATLEIGYVETKYGNDIVSIDMPQSAAATTTAGTPDDDLPF